MPKVNVQFGADTSQLASGVRRAKGQLNSLRSSALQLGATLGVALGARAVIGFVKETVILAAEFEKMKNSLKSVLLPGETVDGILKLSKELAKMPGLGLNEVVTAFVQLKSTGTGTNDAARMIKEIGNAVVSSGGGINEFGLAIKAIQQISGAGKVLGQDLNQLKGAIPSIGGALQKAFGTTIADNISDADKESKKFLDTLLNVLEQGPRVEGGLANSIDNLGIAWETAKRKMGEYFADQKRGGKAPDFLAKVINVASGEEKQERFVGDDWLDDFALGTKGKLSIDDMIKAASDAENVLNIGDKSKQSSQEKAYWDQMLAFSKGEAIPPSKRSIERKEASDALNFDTRGQKLAPSNLGNFLMGFIGDELKAEGLRDKKLQLSEATEARAGMSPGTVVADSLTRIGGGGNASFSANPQLRKMDQTISELKKSVELLERIAEKEGGATYQG